MRFSTKGRGKKDITTIALGLVANASIAVAAHACSPDYVVAKGDTLSKIAKSQLGNVFAYETLFDANRDVIGPNPNLIKIGMSLELPCADATAGSLDWSVMPSPESLALLSQTEDIQILDIRSKKRIAKGVIPGAISIPYKSWAGPKGNPGAPPTEEFLSNLIGQSGLDLRKPIIIVHHKPNMMDIGRAAKIYWLLKSSGAETLAILRDGHSAWVKQDLPIANEPEVASPMAIEVSFSTQWRADLVDVFGVATQQVDGYLLDARPHTAFARFNDVGEAISSTLPGARNTPVKPLMEVLSGAVNVEDGVDEVLAFLQKHQINWREKQVISFCQSGELAALNWFYASEVAQLENMKMFPESVKGWKHLGGNLSVGGSG
ncbi:MAG: rhodanese-like domain-containing protein [Pseudomonadota bacterium]